MKFNLFGEICSYYQLYKHLEQPVVGQFLDYDVFGMAVDLAYEDFKTTLSNQQEFLLHDNFLSELSSCFMVPLMVRIALHFVTSFKGGPCLSCPT